MFFFCCGGGSFLVMDKIKKTKTLNDLHQLILPVPWESCH